MKALDAALPAPTHEIRYVRLNSALIESKQSPFWQKPGEGRFEVRLPGGGSLPIVISRTATLGPDRFVSTGEIAGRPGSRAIFAYNKGFMHASVEDVETGNFALRAATEELSQFYQIDPALLPPCGGSPSPVLDADALATLAKPALKFAEAPKSAGDVNDPTGAGNPTIPPTAAAAGTGVVVHLVVAYTQSVLTTLSGAARTAAILSAIDLDVAGVNSDLAASLVNVRMKLVKTAETQYDETLSAAASVQSDALEALRQTADGKMDELHALRDASGADLVCLLQNRADSSSIGIGYILNTPGSNLNPLFGFCVVRYTDAVPGEHVMSHELGHNLGCVHARGDPQTTVPAGGTASPTNKDGAYTYSYGYRFTAQDGRLYHDIMAYALNSGDTRLGFYSTPNVIVPFPIGAPIGIAAGSPGEADNARTIEQGGFEVANYRLQTQAAFSSGTLQAVSTRAFAGPDDKQLIGGFTITGSQKKKVLIRAGGPVLSPFLSDFLRDPFVTVYNVNVSPPVVMAFNNDWGTNSNSGQIGGLGSGSKDAALLLDLDPGSYTANITGNDGGTGIARIDAYEADGGGAKLFALSTRAYADTTNAMIAGFTVGGAAGTTKRMLIRVRGPSLLRDFGLTSAMDDPYMEIYNGTNDLIMINDDWSSGAGTTNGAPDDFKPFISLYNELQISNAQQLYETGLAPANRREPAVMADFPPGNYTVIIKPFERLTSSPPQLAKPGVAAVDVFEINPK